MLNIFLNLIQHWIRRAILHKYFPDIWYATENWLTAVSSGKKVLEIGCGRGLMTDALVKTKWEVVSVDPSLDSIARAKDRLQENAKLVSFHQCEPERLPFPDNFFDAVTCINILEFVVNPDQVLTEINRVLKPGGKASIIVFKAFSPWDLNFVASTLRKDVHPRPFRAMQKSKFKSMLLHSGMTLDSIKILANYLPIMTKSISFPWFFGGAFVARMAKNQKEITPKTNRGIPDNIEDKRGILSNSKNIKI